MPLSGCKSVAKTANYRHLGFGFSEVKLTIANGDDMRYSLLEVPFVANRGLNNA